MRFFRQQFLPFVYRHLAAVLCIVFTRLLLWPVEQYLAIQVIALLYLLPVIACTVLFGLTPGALAGFVAFLMFNYYSIQPYFTFRVHATQDLLTLLIFLIVAVVISHFIGRAREGTRLARLREWEATRMYELISALAGLQDAGEIARSLAAHTRETFGFAQVDVLVEGRADAPASGEHTPVPLSTARGEEGEMRIVYGRGPLSAEEERLLAAYTSQAALALERIRLMRGENKARVLEESSRLKTSLLNSVSHELRSPLAATKASVSSLRSGAVDWNTAARQDLLATIEEETDHLNLLVGNLLDMSRIESGALLPNRTWNATAEIAMGVATKMRKQLEGHLLELDFPDSLPLVPTDYVMLEQVFVNLISNSVKYAPPATRIVLSARKEGEWLHVRVANQSPPVAEADLERIFEKFHRVTAADRVTGTGLGLSICKGMVEAHGGKIWAENAPDCFVFHFLLPLSLDGTLPQAPKEAGDG